MGEKLLYLIDATAFCYRAFYAFGSLSTSFGQPTSAIYGFVGILNKILKDKKPQYVAVCFDVSRDTFRQKKFAEYKIQRPPMPDELSSQMPFIKEIVSAYGIPIFEKHGFEADDIIATIAKRAKQKHFSSTIISSDKDMLQLVKDDVLVFSPYKDEGVFYDAKKVKERFGVGPAQITDIIALMGDAVDNIQGVPGIGEKTAVQLIKEFGSLTKLLENTDKIKQEKTRRLISENIDKIKLNHELAKLVEDVDIEFDLDKIKISSPDYKELFRIFKHLEFKKFLKDIPVEEKEPDRVKAHRLSDGEVKEFLGQSDELFFYATSPEDASFCSGGRFFNLASLGENSKAILTNPGIKKISHDLKKIKISFARAGITLEGLCFDTMIAAYLANPSKPEYRLNDIILEYLGENIADVPIDTQRALALIVRLKPVLEKELREKELFNLFTELEMPLIEVLADMELNGIKLDLKVLNALSRDIEKRLIKLIEDIYELSGTQFNINSPKQLRDILFEKLKLPVIKKSKTGPSTDEEVLRALANKHKLPALLLEYRQLMKLKTTYIDVLPELIDKTSGRIHTSFNQTATETGRLSSSNPNLQNIPIKTDIGRNIRRAIIAESQNSHLLSCDYSQVELRILAHLSKDENLLQAFNEDKDIHKATASLIYGLPEAEVTDQMREVAKRVNFGIVYGLTSYGLSRDLGIAVDEAQQFIDAYFLRYPKVKEFILAQINNAREKGFVVTMLGRRRYIPEINNKNQGIRQFAERQAVNTPIQGSASDLIKLAMLKVYKEMKQEKMKTKMILQIHDELVFDVPEKEEAKAIELIRRDMENVLSLSAPIRVSIKKGKNWLEMQDVN